VQPSFLGLPALEGYILVILVPIVVALAVILVLVGRRRSKRRAASQGGRAAGLAVPYPATRGSTAYASNSGLSKGSGPSVGPGVPSGAILAPVQFEQGGSGTEGLDPGAASMSAPLINPPDPTCWHCHFQNPPGSRYCASCAVPLEPPPSPGSPPG